MKMLDDIWLGCCQSLYSEVPASRILAPSQVAIDCIRPSTVFAPSFTQKISVMGARQGDVPRICDLKLRQFVLLGSGWQQRLVNLLMCRINMVFYAVIRLDQCVQGAGGCGIKQQPRPMRQHPVCHWFTWRHVD